MSEWLAPLIAELVVIAFRILRTGPGCDFATRSATRVQSTRPCVNMYIVSLVISTLV